MGSAERAWGEPVGLATNREDDVQVLVFDMSSVNDIDSSAERALHELADDFEL